MASTPVGELPLWVRPVHLLCSPVLTDTATGTPEQGGRRSQLAVCPSCGGHLVFDPTEQNLKCRSCQLVVPFDRVAKAPIALPFDPVTAGVADIHRIETLTLTCATCGAATHLGANVVAGSCTYCGTAFVAEAESGQSIPPHAVLPLRMTNKQATDAFRDWAGQRWFAPRSFRQMAAAPDLGSCYLPVWSFDAAASTSYKGRRGKDVTTWSTVTTRDANGNSSTSQVAHTTVEWHKVSGDVVNRFVGLLVSAEWPGTHDLAALSPWELDAAVGYQDEYLLGAAAFSYGVDVAGGFDEARDVMVPTIEQAAKDDIGGAHQRIDDLSTDYSDVTVRQLLVPAWAGAYRVGQRRYTVLINGQTGTVAGERPYSAMKIAVAIAVAIILAALLTFAVASSRHHTTPPNGSPQISSGRPAAGALHEG